MLISFVYQFFVQGKYYSSPFVLPLPSRLMFLLRQNKQKTSVTYQQREISIDKGRLEGMRYDCLLRGVGVFWSISLKIPRKIVLACC